MSNTGGAWDNAKKYLEKEGLKGSDQHKGKALRIIKFILLV